VRQLCQRDAAGVAADQDVDLVAGRQLLDRVDAGLRDLGLIGRHALELATEHAAGGVDLVDRKLRCVKRVPADLQL